MHTHLNERKKIAYLHGGEIMDHLYFLYNFLYLPIFL